MSTREPLRLSLPIGYSEPFPFSRFRVCSALEDGIEKHKEIPVLAPTYRPGVLGRIEPLSNDIAYILGTPNWRAHPIHVQLEKAFPKPLAAYVNRLRHLGADGADSRLLLAHAYVRYLGDLSGGQIIRKRIAKSYEFPKNGNGVRFYVFHEGKGEPEAGPSEMKALKEWFRAGMDTGVGDDEKLKGKWTFLLARFSGG
jgi:heme oxygenase (biliverdin-producing, ferredoxin)